MIDNKTYLFIILILLIIVVSLERQLGSAECAFEASIMVESEIFERANLFGRVDRLAASIALILIVER